MVVVVRGGRSCIVVWIAFHCYSLMIIRCLMRVIPRRLSVRYWRWWWWWWCVVVVVLLFPAAYSIHSDPHSTFSCLLRQWKRRRFAILIYSFIILCWWWPQLVVFGGGWVLFGVIVVRDSPFPNSIVVWRYSIQSHYYCYSIDVFIQLIGGGVDSMEHLIDWNCDRYCWWCWCFALFSIPFHSHYAIVSLKILVDLIVDIRWLIILDVVSFGGIRCCLFIVADDSFPCFRLPHFSQSPRFDSPSIIVWW